MSYTRIFHVHSLLKPFNDRRHMILLTYSPIIILLLCDYVNHQVFVFSTTVGTAIITTRTSIQYIDIISKLQILICLSNGGGVGMRQLTDQIYRKILCVNQMLEVITRFTTA